MFKYSVVATGGRRLGLAALAVTLASVGLVACSSSKSAPAAAGGGSSTSAGTAACVAKANDFLKGWDTLPTTMPASPPGRYVPVAKPPTGKTLVYILQNLQAVTVSSDAAAAASKPLGWTVKTVTYDNTLPDFVAKLESAIQTKPDFIVAGGIPLAAIQKQVDEAKAAGINVILGNVNDTPNSVPGFAGNVGASGVYKIVSQIQAYKVLSDSNCNAHVALFTLDYPFLKTADDDFASIITSNCPACSVKTNIIQGQNIGSPAMTSQELAVLQADSSIKYAYCQIGNLADGLVQALKTAGVTRVKIFGETPDDASIASLRAGTSAWWVNQAPAIQGYDVIDAAVRILATGKPVTDVGGYPLALLTPQNVPAGSGAVLVPSNVLSLYQHLWGI